MFQPPKPLAGIYLCVFNEREVLQETLKVLSKMDMLGMIPNEVFLTSTLIHF